MGETGKRDARAHRSLIPCLVLRGAENTRGLRGERNSIQVDKYKPKEHLLCMPGSKGRTIRKVIGEGGGFLSCLIFFPCKHHFSNGPTLSLSAAWIFTPFQPVEAGSTWLVGLDRRFGVNS